MVPSVAPAPFQISGAMSSTWLASWTEQRGDTHGEEEVVPLLCWSGAKCKTVSTVLIGFGDLGVTEISFLKNICLAWIYNSSGIN